MGRTYIGQLADDEKARFNESWARSFVEKRVDRSGECWLWLGSVNADGYGVLTLTRPRRHMRAHRLAYELFVGPIPDGREIDHLCRERRCVNPDHLEAVTHQENIRRGTGPDVLGARYGTRDACGRGHPYTEDSTYITPAGHRQCRICRALRERV